MHTIISLAEAMARCQLAAVLPQTAAAMADDSALGASPVWLYEEDDVIEGDILLNELLDDGVAGIVALGKLNVIGSVADFEADVPAAFLYVRGDLGAANLICGGAEIVIDGAARIDEVVMGHGPQGHLRVAGELRARLLAVEDHWTEVGAAVNAATLGHGDVLTSWDYARWQEVLSAPAASEFLKADGRWKHGDTVQFIGALVGGARLLRGDLLKR